MKKRVVLLADVEAGSSLGRCNGAVAELMAEAGHPLELLVPESRSNGGLKLLRHSWAVVNLSLPPAELRDLLPLCASAGCHYLDAEPDPLHRVQLETLIGETSQDGPAFIPGLHSAYLLLWLLIDRLCRLSFDHLRLKLEITQPHSPTLAMPIWAVVLESPLRREACETVCARMAKALTRNAARLQIEVASSREVLARVRLQSSVEGRSLEAVPILETLKRLRRRPAAGWLRATDLFGLEEVMNWTRKAGFRVDLPLNLPATQILTERAGIGR